MRSFNERLADCAREARAQAELLPAGDLRDVLIEKARQYEAQISMNVWLFDTTTVRPATPARRAS